MLSWAHVVWWFGVPGGCRVSDATRQGNVIDFSHFAKAGWGSRAAPFYSSCLETEGKPDESGTAEQITVGLANVRENGKHNRYIIWLGMCEPVLIRIGLNLLWEINHAHRVWQFLERLWIESMHLDCWVFLAAVISRVIFVLVLGVFFFLSQSEHWQGIMKLPQRRNEAESAAVPVQLKM